MENKKLSFNERQRIKQVEKYENDEEYRELTKKQKRENYANASQEKKDMIKTRQYLRQLNKGLFDRPKKKTLEKHNIEYDEENKIYFIKNKKNIK